MPEPRSRSTLGLLAVGVVAVSMSGPTMAALSVPALVISMWRNGFAALVIVPTALVRRSAELRALTRADVGPIVVSGLLLSVHFGTWVTSLTMTSVASSTAIVCLQVVWVVAWDRITGIRLPRLAVAGLVVALAGVIVVTGVDFSVSTRALAGDLLALVGGIAVAGYTIIGGRARRTISTTTYTAICYSTAALALLVAAVVSGQQVVGFAPRQWALLLLVTVTAQLLGHSVFNHLLDTVSPMVVSLTLLLEVPGAALLAAVFLGQVPPFGVFVGLALVLAGTATVTIAGPTPPAEAPVS